MKSLRESLFDKDLVQKNIGYQLKNIVFFDGQWVRRLRQGSHIDQIGSILIDEGIKGLNVLEIIDWKKVKQDLKYYKGDDIDLGLYAYANSDYHNMRTSETNRKTEMFVKLILSIPYYEKFEFEKGFGNEFLQNLNLDKYILPKWKSIFYWSIDVHLNWFVIELHCIKIPEDESLLKFEMVQKSE